MSPSEEIRRAQFFTSAGVAYVRINHFTCSVSWSCYSITSWQRTLDARTTEQFTKVPYPTSAYRCRLRVYTMFLKKPTGLKSTLS